MPEDTNKGLAPLNRPLTQNERNLIRWLLEHSNSNVDHLLSQLDRLSVVEKCTCGCPTVYFAVDGEPTSRKGERLIADYLAEVDGDGVGVMLFETKGKLSSLEVYSLAGSEKPFGLPAIASLHGYDGIPKIHNQPYPPNFVSFATQ
jgi:hypothetical protein